jgi:hypothetical protein
MNYVGNPRSQQAKDDTGDLFILRPLHAPVSEPIRASTDDGAIFELLAQVGGRMPGEASHG